MEIKICLIVISALLVVVGAARLYHVYMRTVEKVDDLEKDNQALKETVQDVETSNSELAQTVDDLVKRINSLEEANKLRLPHDAFEEIMHGLAALDVRQREVQLEDSIIENARGHLANALAAGTKRAKR